MIPPADSLLRYETPVLVSRNTEKRSPKVSGQPHWGPTASPRGVPPPARQPHSPPLPPFPQARPLKASPPLQPPVGPVPPPKVKAPSPSVDPSKQAEEILNAILPPR